MNEIARKLDIVRTAIRENDLGGVRLRGSDWYAWATAGASNVVLTAAETGIAEVLITAEQAVIVTDVIEAPRLQSEGFPDGFTSWSHAWQQAALREQFVADAAGGRDVASDRPLPGERELPLRLQLAKLSLTPEEMARYRTLSCEAAAAMTASLEAARPHWSENELAASCAGALMAAGIEPLLVQAGGDERLARFRHLLPTAAALGSRAMLAICARRHGLVASATRFVYFRTPTPAEEKQKHDLARIEAACWNAAAPGRTLASVYEALAAAYLSSGHGAEIDRHHQGGLAGYRAREAIAAPGLELQIPQRCAMAWNPSLTGAKIEDTVAGDAGGIEVLTVDPAWPSFEHGRHARPDFLVRP
ncbi:MAG TPA: M24 family metallopeptidase [Candidatus Binatia bacterium]|nr:M24 family metallopeptidase [Candidatus Binatia bacterium]